MAVNLHVNPTIRKLDANNFVTWVKDMKFVLLEKNLWQLVQGIEKAPELKESDIGSGSAADIKRSEFLRRCGLALSTIYLNISDEYRSLIDNIEDPVKAWKVLAAHFQPDSKARHMSLFSQLLSCYIKPDENVSLYAARLRKISEQLKDIGQPVNEIYLSFQFLRFLPDKFDSIVQSVLRWEDTKFKFDDIVLEISAEETRLKLRDSDKDAIGQSIEIQTANAAYKPKFKAKNKKFKCFKCGRPGHYARSCKFFHRDASFNSDQRLSRRNKNSNGHSSPSYDMSESRQNGRNHKQKFKPRNGGCNGVEDDRVKIY